MSFGATGVVGQAFGLAMRNMFKVVGLYIIFGIGAMLISGLFMFLAGGAFATVDPMTGMPRFSPIMLIGSVLSNLLMVSASLAAFVLMTRDATGSPSSFGEALVEGVRKTPIAVVVLIVVMLAVVLAMIVPGLLIGGLFAISGGEPVVVLAGYVLFFAVAVWINAAISPLFPLLVNEDAGLGAVRRAFEMTKGYRWPIVGAMVLLGLVAGAIFLLFGGVMAMMMGGAMHSPDAMGGAFIVMGLLYLVMIAFMGSLGTALQAAIYARLAEIE